MLKSKELKFWLVFILIFAWIFSGWPQISENLQLPPRIEKAYATGPTVKIFLTNTASTTWVVPSDWNNASNTIEAIGGGGGGVNGGTASPAGAGGGGGAYAKIKNLSLTAGGNVTVQVGTGGGAATAGGDTIFNGSGTTCTAGQSVCAKGGSGASGGTGGGGGASSTSIITGTGGIKVSGGGGGNGGASATGGGGGGGGAAGPNGTGANGGAGAGTTNGGGGGGGGNGGGFAGATTTTATGGTGGNNYSNTSGSGGSANSNGTNGGGGGGGTGLSTGTGNNGGNGSMGLEWSGNGSGGGGGGGGGSSKTAKSGGNGGATALSNTGAGGGGGGNGKSGTSVGASGDKGLIVISYDPIISVILGDGTNPSNTTIGPSGTSTNVDAFTLWSSTTTVAITNVTVTLAVNTTSSISKVEIRDSSGATTYGSTTAPTANSFLISLTGANASNSTSTFEIYITPKSYAAMPPQPGIDYNVTSTITAFTATGADTTSGSDPGSATLTIDNSAPADVTNASGTLSGTNLNLSWTTPLNSDYATTTVLRATSTIGNFPLTDGTAYSTGTAVTATTTVACVVGGSSNTTVGCTDSGLSAGTSYYYEVIAGDTFDNYSTGTAPTGSPFTPSVSTVSCSTNIASTAFGTLTTASVFTASPNASTTMTCNGALGCTLNINDAGNGTNGGLATTSPAYIIPSPAAGFPATATLSAGTEGYGIQATTTASGSGGALGINSRYLQTGNAVGGLTISTLALASSTSAVTNREIVVTHEVAISSSTQAGAYTDIITYSCVGN